MSCLCLLWQVLLYRPLTIIYQFISSAAKLQKSNRFMPIRSKSVVNGSSAAASFHPIKINQRISLSSLAESRTTSWKHCFIQNGMRSREEEEKVIIYWIKIRTNVLDPIDRSYFEIQRKSKKNVQSERRTYLNKVQSLNESWHNRQL